MAAWLPGEGGKIWAFCRMNFQQDPRRCIIPLLSEQSWHFTYPHSLAVYCGLLSGLAARLPGVEYEAWAFLRIRFQQDTRRCSKSILLKNHHVLRSRLQHCLKVRC